MPDIASTRPASGAPIATAWGAEVHDQLEGIQTGSVVINVASGSSGTAVVPFPRPYATAPRVFLTVQNTPSNVATHAWLATAGATPSQVTIAAGRDDATAFSGAITVGWLAIGTPA